MDITDVRINRMSGKGNLVAYVAVTFDNCFVVHNIKIIKGHDGYFIAMPRRKILNGTYKDIAHPINTDFRVSLQNCVIKAFEDEIATPASETLSC